ncbi:MAG: hypothetical protein H3C35_12455 [Bacteroidetes bacterium]|nr:hypothetical protein [Bacteroidota bacterium]
MSRQPRYWLVGANWGGDDQATAFYRRGYWELGWADEDQPKMAKARDSIQAGDRIAIKSMRGKGSDSITIKGLGLVKEVADGKVYINWLITDMSRKVFAKGCFSSIHGPYSIASDDAKWIREVFSI